MAKLTDKQKKQIIADYVATGNYAEAARRTAVSLHYSPEWAICLHWPHEAGGGTKEIGN